MTRYHATANGNVPFTQEEEAEWDARESAIDVPQAVTPLQGMLALDQAGMSAAYEAWASSPSRTFAERAFIDKAQTWRRDNEVLCGGCAALGITSDQLDNLFRLASTL